MKNQNFLTATAMAVFFGFCPTARAQGTGGTISGTVTDRAAAAVPGATVSVLDVAKGETRTLPTNDLGFYSAPNLMPGHYDVTVSAPGFSGAVEKDILLEVGQEVVVNIQLNVGDVHEKVVVTSDVSQLTTTTATLSNVVAGPVVRELPLNGRDWTLLAALEPGVHSIEAQSAVTVGGNARGNRGFGTQLTIGGNRPQQNNYRLDGITLNDYSGSGPGNVIGSALGVDAIQEFSVVTGNASADYGRTSGGVINAVTRSGESQFHGSAYEFLRNSALDARNFFDAATIPPFKRNQFGGSLGGPLYHKTFFFADYEGLRQDLGTTTPITVPSNAARAGQLVGGTVTVDPRAQPYLAIFPLADPGTVVGDSGTHSFVAQAITTENLVTGRIDHQFSDKNSLNGTFFIDSSKTTGPDGFDFVLVGQKADRKTYSIQETHIFRPNLLNIARFGYNRAVVSAPQNLAAINPLATNTSLGFEPNSPAGSIQISGLTVFNGGLGGIGETDYHYGSYQVYDDLLYTKGAHSLKFGGAAERIQSNEFAIGDPIGRYTFGSLKNFLTDHPQTFNATLPGTNPTIYLRQTVFGAYVQDDYRFRKNLTLNLGVRYEIATVPTENFNRLSNLTPITASQPQLGSPYFQNPTFKNVSPRVGFAWDPFKDGKAAVRGAFGIYDTLPLTYLYELLVVNTNPFSQAGSVQLTTLPGSFPTGGFPRLTSNTLRFGSVELNPRRSYVEQWNLNVQRQLPGSIVLLVGYLGETGVHQPYRTNDANIVPPTVTAQGLVWPTPRGSGTVLNPSVGVINALNWEASNTYHGLNVGVTRQQKGLRFGFSYTWSKSIDDNSNSIAGGTFTNSIQGSLLAFPYIMRGLSDFDVRHNFVFNYLGEIPHPGTSQAVLKWATNGWQLGGILRVASGLPFTPTIGGDPLGMKNANPFDFPDRVNAPGCSDPVNPGNQLNYVKTACFVVPSNPARLGNSGRNSVIGPSIRNFDLSLIKNNKLTERLGMQFRAEFFNVFNHTNFAVPDRTTAQLFNQNLAPIATAGRLNATSTTSRQLQFALKFTF